MKDDSGWTLKEARNTLLRIEAILQPHYHVGMLGSVLHKGHSENDLDIVIFPDSSPRFDVEEVQGLLKGMGLELKVPRDTVLKYWRKKGSNDNKYVEVWFDEIGRRIDVFYWKDFT